MNENPLESGGILLQVSSIVPASTRGVLVFFHFQAGRYSSRDPHNQYQHIESKIRTIVYVVKAGARKFSTI